MFSRLLLWGQLRIEKGAWFFAPLSYVWGFCSFARHFLYDWKILRQTSVSCPVVSVGNLVAGGAGKTPLVHLLASHFSQKNIAILSRGYGSCPDEAMLLARRLRVKVYVGKNRVKLAQQAAREGADMILLDDGFQHRALQRDFDLVVLKGGDPFGKGHFLPWGFLRDSPSRLKQADAIFVSGKVFGEGQIGLRIKVERVLNLEGEAVSSIENLAVAMFCGIANPSFFRKTLEGLGANILGEWILPDHGKIVDESLEIFAKKMKKRGALALVCTEKDAVKLWGKSFSLPIYYVEISFEVAEGIEEWEKLIAKIEQKIDNTKQ